MKTQAKRKSTSAKHRMEYADRLFREYIRERDQTCRMGPTDCDGPLEAAHVFPRRRKSVRWDPDNAVLLCAYKHHYWFDTEGLQRWAWIQHELGAERYEALSVRQLQPFDRDYDRVLAELKALKAGL